MANRLNVLVGAALEQNVEKNLNRQLGELANKLNSIPVKINFDESSTKVFEDAIKKSLQNLFKNVEFVKTDAGKIGVAIAESVTQGFADSRTGVNKQLEAIGKDAVKAASDMGDAIGEEFGKALSEKTTRVFAENAVGEQDLKSYIVDAVYKNGVKVSRKTNYHEKDGREWTTGSTVIVDDGERQRQKAEKDALDMQNKYHEQAAKKQEKTWNKYNKFMMKINTELRENQEKNWANILDTLDKTEQKVAEVSNVYGNLRDVSGKKFFKKDEFNSYEKALNEITQDVVRYKDNAEKLAEVQKRLNDLLYGVTDREANLAQSVKADEKARKEKAKHNEEVKKAKEIYEELNRSLTESKRRYAELKNAYPHMDFSQQEKELASLGSSVAAYGKYVNDSSRDTQFFIDLQKKLSAKKTSVDSFDSNLNKQYISEKKNIEEAIERERKANDKLYQAKLKWADQERRATEVADKDRLKQLNVMYDTWQQAQSKVDSFDAYKGLKDIDGKKMFDDSKIEEFNKALEILAIDMDEYENDVESLIIVQKQLNELLGQINTTDSGMKTRIAENEKVEKAFLESAKKQYDGQARASQKYYSQELKWAEENRLKKEKLKSVSIELNNVLESLYSKTNYEIFNKDDAESVSRYEKVLDSVNNLLAKDKVSTEGLENATKRLIAVLKEANSLSSGLDADKNTYNKAQDKIDKQRQNVEARIKTMRSQFDIKSAQLKSKYGDLFDEEEFRRILGTVQEIESELNQTIPDFQRINQLFQKMNTSSKKFETNLSANAKEIGQIRKEAQLLNTSLGRFVQFYGFGELFRGIKTAATSMFEQIKLVDSAMVELKKVTSETKYTYDKFLDGAASKAKELGVTMSDYVDSVTEFARMGETFGNSQILAESANVMQMVSENLTAEQASQYLISTIKGFNLEASKSMAIVDALNNVSNNFSITTDGLGEALKRSSASMSAANNSLEQTIALITTANEVTQNPESVGNALKTVSMRIRGVVTDDDEDGATVLEPAKLGKIIEEVTAPYRDGIGISIMADENTFKSTYQILYELSTVWDKLKDTEKAYLLEKISGKHRATQIAAILSNGERLSEAYATALQSSGSAMEEFEKRTESIEYHLSQLSAAWQELSSNAVTVDFVNGIIDSLRFFVESINDIGVLNVISGLVGAFGGLMIKGKGIPMLEAIGKKEIAESTENIGGMTKAYSSMLEMITKKSPVAIGAMKSLTSVGKLLLSLGAGGLGFMAVTAVLGVIFDKFEEYANIGEDVKDKVSVLTAEVEKLQSEYDFLSTKDNLTSAEKERLEILKDEIELQKADLELSKDRLAEFDAKKYNGIKTTVSMFGEGTDYKTGEPTADEVLAADIDKSITSYAKAKKEIKGLREEVAEVNDTYKDAARATSEFREKNEILSGISEKITAAEEEKKAALEQTQANYDSLITQQQELERIVNSSNGYSEEELNYYKEKLKATEDDIELHKILLGIEGASAEFAKEQLEYLDTYKRLSGIVDKLNAGEGITKKQLEELKKEYPELTDEMFTYGEVAEESYGASKEALEMLSVAQAQSLSTMNENEIQRTISARDEAKKRLRIYSAEVGALNVLQGAMASMQGTRTDLANKAEETGSILDKANSAIFSLQAAESEGMMTVASFLLDKRGKIDETQQIIADADAKIKEFEELLNSDDLGEGTGIDDLTTSLNGLSSATDDAWDKYANALAQVQEQLDSFNSSIELTEAKLSKNQANEKRTIDLLAEEQELYGELIGQQEARYKLLNDTLYLQLQQIKAVKQEAAERVAIRSPQYDISDFENWTKADVDKYIEMELKVDSSEADADLENYLNHMIEFGEAVDENHQKWYEFKQEIAETKLAAIKVSIDWQNDTLDQYDDARKQSEMLLDILEEVEDTEQNRIGILNSITASYDHQKETIMSMHKANADLMESLGQDMQANGQEYNTLLKQNQKLEEDYLDALQAQLGYKKQLAEAAREHAEAEAEVNVYGSGGRDSWEDARQDEIDALQKQLDAIEERNDEDNYAKQMIELQEDLAEKEQELAELQEKLANLRNQKTVQQLEEQADGSYQWKYVEDQIAINETIEELADKQNEIEDAKNAIKEAQDEKAIEDEKAAIQNRIDNIQAEVDARAEQYEREMQIIEQAYQQEMTTLQKWLEEEITNWKKRVSENEKGLQKYTTVQTEGLEIANEATDESLSILENTYATHFASIYSIIRSNADKAIAAINQIRAAQRAAAEEAAAAARAGADGSHANGLKFVESNNYLARLHYGERVLTRQEAEQYNELEEDIKSGKLKAYFDSFKEDAVNTVSSIAANNIASTQTTTPVYGGQTTQITIGTIELPNVQNPTDFAQVLDSWARNEFGGMASKAKITRVK